MNVPKVVFIFYKKNILYYIMYVFIFIYLQLLMFFKYLFIYVFCQIQPRHVLKTLGGLNIPSENTLNGDSDGVYFPKRRTTTFPSSKICTKEAFESSELFTYSTSTRMRSCLAGGDETDLTFS